MRSGLVPGVVHDVARDASKGLPLEDRPETARRLIIGGSGMTVLSALLWNALIFGSTCINNGVAHTCGVLGDYDSFGTFGIVGGLATVIVGTTLLAHAETVQRGTAWPRAFAGNAGPDASS